MPHYDLNASALERDPHAIRLIAGLFRDPPTEPTREYINQIKDLGSRWFARELAWIPPEKRRHRLQELMDARDDGGEILDAIGAELFSLERAARKNQ